MSRLGAPALALMAACASAGTPVVQNAPSATPPVTAHEAQFIPPDLPHAAIAIERDCSELQGKGVPVLLDRRTIDPSHWAYILEVADPHAISDAFKCIRKALAAVGSPQTGSCEADFGPIDRGGLAIILECGPAKEARQGVEDTLKGE